MAFLQVGDVVEHISGSHHGTLVEVDAGIAYIEQKNGVEVDFRLSELRPYVAPKASEKPSGLRDRDITPEHENLLRALPDDALARVQVLYEDSKGKAGPRRSWNGLSTAAKLNVINGYLSDEKLCRRERLLRELAVILAASGKVLGKDAA